MIWEYIIAFFNNLAGLGNFLTTESITIGSVTLTPLTVFTGSSFFVVIGIAIAKALIQ